MTSKRRHRSNKKRRQNQSSSEARESFRAVDDPASGIRYPSAGDAKNVVVLPDHGFRLAYAEAAWAFVDRRPDAHARLALLQRRYPDGRYADAVSRLELRYRKRRLREVDDGEGPRPETRARPTPQAGDVIVSLIEKGDLDVWHGQAADEIRTIHEAVASRLDARAATFEIRGTKSGGSDSDGGLTARLARLHHDVYQPWIDRLGGWNARRCKVVLRIVIDGLGLESVARRHRLTRDGALTMLKAALNDYLWRGGG